MNGGAWWAAVHGVAKSQIRLSDFTFTFHFPALADGFFTARAIWEAGHKYQVGTNITVVFALLKFAVWY